MRAAALAMPSACASPGMTSVNSGALIPATAGEKVADIFNKAHPRIHVDVSWILQGNAGGYQKLYPDWSW